MTKRKEELIEGSRTDAQREAFDLARKAMDESVPVALSMKDIEQYVKMAVKGRVFDSDYELRKVMKEAGMAVFDKRIVVSGRQQYVLLNQVLDRRLREVLEAEQHTEIVKSIKKAQDLLPVNM
jgi:hypothetical protein